MGAFAPYREPTAMPEYNEGNESFSQQPEEPVGDFRPVTIPDLRKRSPRLRRAARWVLILCAAAAVVAGVVLFLDGRERRDVERVIRQQYPAQTNNQIASLSLTSSGDKKYAGTLTTTDGETLDVTAECPPRRGSAGSSGRRGRRGSA